MKILIICIPSISVFLTSMLLSATPTVNLLMDPVLNLFSLNPGETLHPSSSEEATLYGFYFSKRKSPSPMDDISAKSNAQIAVSYYTSGFDFTASLVNGTHFDKIRTEGRLSELSIKDNDPISFSFGTLLVKKVTFPIKDNTTPEAAEKKAQCVKKEYTVLISKEEIKFFGVAKIVLKAVALHCADRLNDQYEYKIEGHGWLESVSSPELLENDKGCFLKIDVVLLMPKA